MFTRDQQVDLGAERSQVSYSSTQNTRRNVYPSLGNLEAFNFDFSGLKNLRPCGFY